MLLQQCSNSAVDDCTALCVTVQDSAFQYFQEVRIDVITLYLQQAFYFCFKRVFTV